MMESEYYLIGRDANPNAPLLRPDNGQSTWFLIEEAPAKFTEPMRLAFNDPVPRKPELLDYHSLPDSVVSKKIYDVLSPMNIYGIQLVPAVIRDNRDNNIENYWVIQVWNQIECLDMEHAIYDFNERRGKVSDIDKLVIDRQKLSAIPLEKRLVFLLKEGISRKIYHQSIVDAIMAAEPEGIRFSPVNEWHEGV